MWCKELLVTIIVLLLFMAFMFWKLLKKNCKMIIWDLMNWYLVVHRNPVVNWNKIHVNYPLSTILLFISIFWGLINVISARRENLQSHKQSVLVLIVVSFCISVLLDTLDVTQLFTIHYPLISCFCSQLGFKCQVVSACFLNSCYKLAREKSSSFHHDVIRFPW